MGVGPVEKDASGEFQRISYFGIKIRVPPLHTWSHGYIIQPDYPLAGIRGLTLELTPRGDERK